jgi:hypothetical protein
MFYPDDKRQKRSRILFILLSQLNKYINYLVFKVHDDVSSYGSENKLFYFIYLFIHLFRNELIDPQFSPTACFVPGGQS